jgi:hypothetical protein
VGVTLQSQLAVSVAQQTLYCFRINVHPHQERSQAVTQIVEAESSRIILYQSAFLISVRGKNAHPRCRWPKIVFHQHVGNPWSRAARSE